MKFRKKPVVIDAVKFDSMKPETWPPCVYMTAAGRHPDAGNHAVICTIEGEMHVENGDWIITGVKGEHYPCKPDTFEMTYERVKQRKPE